MSLDGAYQEGAAVATLSHASKFYGGFAALKDVSLSLIPGEVHMLLGENGAGKSTVVSLLTGMNRLDEGERTLRGNLAPHLTPGKARRAGVNAVLQDFSLAPAMTVEENYALGREPLRAGFLDKRRNRTETNRMLKKLGLDIDPRRRVDTLSRAEQQMLEIARALKGERGVLILDEPTASLSHEETARLFDIVRLLRTDGWAILYISHRMEEMRELGDVVTILRDGRLTGNYHLADVTNEHIITDMVGRKMEEFYPDIPHRRGDCALELNRLTSENAFSDVSLTVYEGEIVGLGGLVGCGKAELARALFGLRATSGGTFSIEGLRITDPTPRSMLACGLIYLPEDRRNEALVMNRTMSENIVLEVLGDPENVRGGLVRDGNLGRLVDRLLDQLNVNPKQPRKKVAELSGGNQQKVVLGRALSRQRKVFIFHEPTTGVDVGARLEFYRQLARLCEEGAAILLVTSDLQELLHLSHRAYVMAGGRIVADLPKHQLRDEIVAAYAFGEEPEQGNQT